MTSQSSSEEIARCDREIADILARPDVQSGNAPAWIVTLGIEDWGMTPYYDYGGITIYHGDWIEPIASIPLVDCCVTDPPYGETSLDWDTAELAWLSAMDRVIAPAGSVWSFGSLKYLTRLLTSQGMAAWKHAQEIVWSYALRLAGWPDDREVWTGSCPCQPFSAAGKGQAFNDERHLWPEFFRLIEARRPVVCFGEQVASIDGLTWLDLVQSDLDGAGYTCGAIDLCAAGFGAPHRRQRLYWVADNSCGGGRQERPDGGRIGAGDGAQGWPSGPDASGISDGLGYASSQRLEVGRRKPGHAGQKRASPERTSDAGRLENSVRAERRPDQWERDGHREASGRNESADRSGERGETERLDNSTSSRYNGAVPGSERDPRDDARMRVPSERSSADIVGYSEAVRCEQRNMGDKTEAERTASADEPLVIENQGSWGNDVADGCELGILADSDGSDSSAEREQRSGQLGQQPQDGRDVPVARGPVNGFWKDANWVLTRPQRVGDRPGLRPVERGAFPLAHGATARVGRLRGYGDGIVAQAAKGFIEAYLECSQISGQEI